MERITKEQKQELQNAYNKYFEGLNWGQWLVKHAPRLPVGYKLLQYINNKDQICDVVKFDETVEIEGVGTGRIFSLNKYKPNHKVDASLRKAPEKTTKMCQECGNYYPIHDSSIWYSSRCCVSCNKERLNKIQKIFRREKEKLNNPKRRAIWVHWARHHGGGNNYSVEELMKLWNDA